MLTVTPAEMAAAVRSLLDQGLTATIRPSGGSMRPFINPATDEVVISRLPSYGIDCIVFADVPGMGVMLHRVVAAEGDHFVLMGDANLQQRERCSAADIIGAVTEIRRSGKAISTNDASFLRRSRLWRHLLPIRRLLLHIVH